MLRRHELHLYLGFLCEIAAPDVARGEFELLRSLQEVVGSSEVPVHWFLPPMMFEPEAQDSPADLLGVLRPRLDRGLDRFAVVGFRGSFHPLLRHRNVERDLRWATRNPWKTGAAAAMGHQPVMVFPFHPDLGRPGILPLYRRAGFDSVAVLFRPDRAESYSLLWQEPETGLRFLSMVRAEPNGAEMIGSLEKTVHNPADRAFFLLFSGGPGTAGRARETLRRLARRYALRWHAWPETTATPHAVSPDELASMGEGALPCTPGARHGWLRAEPLRHSARNADARELLDALSHRDRELASIPSGELDVRPRLASSVMPGKVTLGGPGFEVCFDDGRLCALLRRGAPLFPLSALRAELLTPSGCRAFATESATSFDEEDSRGLRAVLRLDDGTLIVDYAIAGSWPGLLVHYHASFPTVPPDCRAVLPFGLVVPLPSAGSEPRICSVAGDGSRQERPAEAPGKVHTASGKAFLVTVAGASLSLTFPEGRGLSVRPLQWTVEGRGAARELILNPFGTFYAKEAPEYSGMREELTVILAPGDHPPRLPPSIRRLCVEHRVLRRPAPPPPSRLPRPRGRPA